MFKLCKKILYLGLSTVAICAAHSALADNQYIYAGVAPIFSETNFQWQNSDTGSDTNPGNGQTVTNGSSSNTQVGVFIGYGVLIDKVYIGAEGSTQFGNRASTSQTQDFNTQAPLTDTITMNDIYIIDFRPGYVLNDKNSLIYGVLGLNTASFAAQQQNSDGLILQDSGSIRKNGIRLGIGYNLGLGKYFMARAEYVFTKFSDYQFTDTFPNGSETHTWDFNPYSNEFSLGLAVVFNV